MRICHRKAKGDSRERYEISSNYRRRDHGVDGGISPAKGGRAIHSLRSFGSPGRADPERARRRISGGVWTEHDSGNVSGNNGTGARTGAGGKAHLLQSCRREPLCCAKWEAGEFADIGAQVFTDPALFGQSEVPIGGGT